MNFTEFKNKYENIPVEHYPSNVSDDPLVSVCVQTYQHEDYIQDCLDGILMQETNFPFEILLGEDASTDRTREICIEYAEKYPDRIKLFLHHRENNIAIAGQPTGRFNFLYNLYSANGIYIALCEGDDYWTDPFKLQKQVDFLESHPKFSMCCTNYSEIDEQGKVIKKIGWEGQKRNKKVIPHEVILKTYGPKVLTTLISKSSLPSNYPEELHSSPNGDNFLFAMISESGPAYYMDEVTGFYRNHGESIWSSKDFIRKKEMQLQTFSNMKKVFRKDEQQIAINYRLEKMRRKLAIAYSSELELTKALYHMSYFVKFNLNNFKAVLRLLVNMSYKIFESFLSKKKITIV